MNENDSNHNNSIFLYVVISALSLALIALGALTLFSLDKLARLQGKVNTLQQSAVDIADSYTAMSEMADQLEKLEAQGITFQAQEAAGPQPQGEGTLSPSHANSNSTFTENKDDSMDNLLSQINNLLPKDNGTWSVYVCNLLKNSDGAINDKPMQAASLIKLFIMGTIYENYNLLSQEYGKDALDSNLQAMITVSDNDAANRLVTWLGGGNNTDGMAKVNAFCQKHGYKNTSMGRMLLEGNENGDNFTSVTDCGNFLKEIYKINKGTAQNPTLVNAEMMYYLLKLQTRVNKIPAQMPEGVHVANKTGELSNVENDAGIVYDTAKGIDLVICFMAEGVGDTAAAQKAIADDSRMIYGYYNE